MDDAFHKQATRAAALEIGKWLEESGMLNQPIRNLSLWQLEAMAATSISRFIKDAAERHAAGEALPPPLQSILFRLTHHLCVLCGREARGFGFQLRLDSTMPRYWFCSLAHLDVGARIAEANMGEIKLTGMEERAIRAARSFFAEALERNGLMPAFEDCTGSQIDDLIKAAVLGFQASMGQQSDAGQVPF